MLTPQECTHGRVTQELGIQSRWASLLFIPFIYLFIYWAFCGAEDEAQHLVHHGKLALSYSLCNSEAVNSNLILFIYFSFVSQSLGYSGLLLLTSE